MATFTFSMFTAHFSANKSRIPAATASRIRREAIARVQKRMQAGRADGVLDFSDLVEQIESAL